MITLPARPAPNGVTPAFIDPGMLQRGGTGGLTRIDRPGMKMSAEVSYPSMDAATARVFVSRLMRAKSQGLTLKWQLLGEDQGLPGAVKVDGGPGQSKGTTLYARGLVPGYPAKEGYWLNVIDADGQVYLHNVGALAVAGLDGKAVLSVWPPLRASLTDGSAIELRAPVIAGQVTSEMKWPLPVERRVTLGFTIEEAA